MLYRARTRMMRARDERERRIAEKMGSMMYAVRQRSGVNEGLKHDMALGGRALRRVWNH